MEGNLQSWQHAVIRNTMKKYRETVESHYIQGKRMVEVAPGEWAFSLLSPPLGSTAAKRRVRFIARNVNAPEAAGPSTDENLFWRARTPHFVTLAVTYNCQCDCAHCSAQEYREKTARDRNALTFDELRDTLHQAAELGTTGIVLVGGEPLLHPRICEIIQSVDKSRSICSMFSNGEFLTHDMALRLKEAGLYGVYVSLDSVDPEIQRPQPPQAGAVRQGRGCHQARPGGRTAHRHRYLCHEGEPRQRRPQRTRRTRA